MIIGKAYRLVMLLAAVLPMFLGAQDREDLLSEVSRSRPGKERAIKLIEISERERSEGRPRFAVEFAILGSAEAEQNGLRLEFAKAQMQLCLAHLAKGDHEKAMAACFRIIRDPESKGNGMFSKATVQLASSYLQIGHAQKALELLASANDEGLLMGTDRPMALELEARARAQVFAPADNIEHCEKALAALGTGDDDDLRLELLSQLASAQASSGKNEEALFTEQQVLQLAISMDRPMEAGVSANNIGELHQRLGHVDEALKAFAKGLIMVEDVPALRTTMQMNAAHAHARNGGAEIAMRIIDEAIRTARKGTNDRDLARLLRTKAAIRQLQGELGEAQDRALEALRIAEKNDDLAEAAAACALLAGLYDQIDLDVEARTYRKRAIQLEKTIQANNDRQRSEWEAQLIRLQRVEIEQFELSNREENKESRLKELALNAENHKKQLELLMYEKQLDAAARREALLARDQADQALHLAQAALEKERQERLILDLENNRMLQSLTMARMQAEQKEKQKHLELLEERSRRMEARSRSLAAETARNKIQERNYIILASGISLLSILLFAAWQSTRLKKRTIWKQNQQIQGINRTLAEKDIDIQSSLNYARTIQSAILPTEPQLQQLIPQSFLIYRPLDQVSGDLPFVKQVGDTIYLAAIDCTGHGVPAAMMTFIAYYGLNQLIGDSPDIPCGELLDRLHTHVNTTMSARNGGLMYNDGMDIGLCRFDQRRGRLSFSGAQLSLFHVRNGEVQRIKGDTLPLGDDQFQRATGYTEHCMQLQEGDSVFLFSDGLIHQFGGPDGRKKFSLRKLKELLEHSSELDLMDLRDRTEALFNDWKGEQPQTDDVLLIGLRYAA